MYVIETEKLTRLFGKSTAVDSLDLSVAAGEIFGLLGPNGAGKSTTIKMLTALLPPSSGKARVAGFDLAKNQAGLRRAIGYVPQLISADGALTGYENLLVFARLYDIPSRVCAEHVRATLAFMGLEEAADKLVRKFSGGMIRRLEIAQALLHRPRVLFLDEPTVGLDPVARKAVWERIVQLRQTYGTTILLTTHYMEEADQLCNRVAIMHLGRVVAAGGPALLKAEIGPKATLDDVFSHYTGETLQAGGDYRETRRTRRSAKRLN